MSVTSFFSTPLGRSALISVLAMVAMNCMVLSRPAAFDQQMGGHQIVRTSAAVTGELA